MRTPLYCGVCAASCTAEVLSPVHGKKSGSRAPHIAHHVCRRNMSVCRKGAFPRRGVPGVVFLAEERCALPHIWRCGSPRMPLLTSMHAML